MNLADGIPLLLLCVFMGSCAAHNPAAPSNSPIQGTTWKLRSIQEPGSEKTEIPDPARFTLLLGEDNRANVRADCNVCSGNYDLGDSSLRLTPLACTRAFCGTNSPDVRFLRALHSNSSVTRTGGTFILEAAGAVLEFAE